MKMKRNALAFTCCCIVAGGLARGQTGSHTPRLWVANASGTISIVDTATNAVVGSMTLPDADGNGKPEPAVGLAIAPDAAHAFVISSRYLFVIDVASRTTIRTWNIGTMLGLPGLELAGCASGVPAPFGSRGLESLLHVAFTLVTAPAPLQPGARWLVLDQACLVSSGVCDPRVDTGSLEDGPGVRALGVRVLQGPAGDAVPRAWYSVSDSTASRVLSVLVAGTRDRDFRTRDVVSATLPSSLALPSVLQIGSPHDLELNVMPLGRQGLVNLNTGARCNPGGSFTAVGVSGPGPDAHKVFAVVADRRELLVLDPRDCTGPSFPLGLAPTGIAILENVNHASAFVANSGSDTVTRVDDLGATEIALCPSGGCNLNPVALDLVAPGCRADGLSVTTIPGTTQVELDWHLVGCPEGTDSGLWCKCMTNELDCPCRCACVDDEPNCSCSNDLFGGAAKGLPTPGLQLTTYMWNPVPGTGWKKLGTEPPYVHETEGYELSYIVLPIPPLPMN
jgi:hypothetical protein